MANKTLVSIDDMIEKYNSVFSLCSMKIQDLVDDLSFDSSTVDDVVYHDFFCFRVDNIISKLPGMVDFIYEFSGDYDFYLLETTRISSLKRDAICLYLEHKSVYLSSLQEGEAEAC